MLFIFDWDGTLIDSAEKIVACMQQAASSQGLPVPDAGQAKNIIGLGLPQAVSELFPELNEGAVNAFCQAYSGYFIAADQIPCTFFPDVQETLIQLRAEGHQLAVATGKSRKGLDRALANQGMTSFFDSTRCADETASKPDPLMLYEIMSELACSSQCAVMVGDTEYDMAMATSAGVRRIAVNYGVHTPERLRPYKPCMLIGNLRKILDWCPSEAVLG